MNLEELAQVLDEAAQQVQLIPQVTTHTELTLDDAYAVQAASIGRRLARGERLIGMKMGLTSPAKMRQMGINTPIYGHLTDAMRLDCGGRLSLDRLRQPRVEP